MNLAAYFKALGDETRLRLLNLLRHHELNVNEIVSIMDMGQSRVSRHLKILTDCGLLKYRRDGLWAFYSAESEGRGARLLELLADFIGTDEEMSADYKELSKMIEEGYRQRTRFFDSIASDWNEIKQSILAFEFLVCGNVCRQCLRCII